MLFESRDVEQLAERMLRLAPREVHEPWGRAARQRVERLFSRRSWVEGDEQVYLRWVG